MDKQQIHQDVELWLKGVVIGLQLCPFAKAPMVKKRIHYCISEAKSEEALNEDLIRECKRLDTNKTIETTLLICPTVLSDFFDFCQYLDWANTQLKQHGWVGIYQIAHFHPDYCFAGADTSAPENYTNRSPYPILHLLREASLEAVLNHFETPEDIPEKNVETMRNLGEEERQRYFYFLTRDE